VTGVDPFGLFRLGIAVALDESLLPVRGVVEVVNSGIGLAAVLLWMPASSTFFRLRNPSLAPATIGPTGPAPDAPTATGRNRPDRSG
jgi:hypothetical protein